MDVCNCIVPSRHRSTINSHRATSPLVSLGLERWEAPDHPQVSSFKIGRIEPNRTVTCMVLKATANDRRHLALFHDEFRGPRFGFCRSATRRFSAMDLLVFNHGQATRTTPELPLLSLNFHTTPTRGFRVTRDLTCISPSTRRVFSGAKARCHNVYILSKRETETKPMED
ncbi:uncharacterized protein TNCV_636001 [Trichonephila clavipes]|nr:uncharacterized protein TNCV_636001 [Trichonephila clavipes]